MDLDVGHIPRSTEHISSFGCYFTQVQVIAMSLLSCCQSQNVPKHNYRHVLSLKLQHTELRFICKVCLPVSLGLDGTVSSYKL